MSGQIKNTLFILVSAAFLVGSIFLFMKPNLEEKSALENEVATLSQKYTDLQEKEANRPIYEAGIVQNKEKFQEILDQFPADIQQENYIKMLGDMVDNKDLDFNMTNMDFNDKEAFYVLGQGTVAADGTTEATTATTDAADAAATTTDAAATTADAAATDAETVAAATEVDAIMDEDMTAYRLNMSVNYNGSYKGIKNLLAYVKGNAERMTIDEMSLTYSEEDKELTGTFSFNLYAINSPSRILPEPDLNDIDTSVENIFDSSDKTSSKVDKKFSSNLDDGENILDDYDHFIALEPSTSDADAITIGAKNDTQSYLSSNENSVQNVTVKYFIVGEKYYVSYIIGNNSYPENYEQGVEFDPGEELNLAILSSNRKNDKDKSGIKLVLDNETDIALNVKIDGDDASNPRVKIVSRVGKVNVYE